VQRGLRMREGITSTLAIFQPYDVRGTFFATGYNFLLSNTTRVQFMDNPTYQWASRENRWLSDRWQQTPWFAPDPYGTAQSHPAWYFGDLVPILQQAGQDIQSHTFSHFYGGFVGPDDWRADFAAWDAVAARHGVPSARVLAFPWSSSGGMSDANWRVLQQEGIQAVTRLSHQTQYNLFPRDERGLAQEPRCRPVPGHEQILACPDFYLTPASAERAITQIDLALDAGGMIDIWSHSEEVVTPEQRAAWQQVVRYAATRPGLWVAPLREITAWQQALEAVTLEVQAVPASGEAAEAAPLTFRVHNGSRRRLEGLTLRLPFEARRVLLENGQEYAARDTRLLVLDMRAGQTLEVQAWPEM
jgi:peptidoglycan/xylan/chitin deacetylase (PgdA/CDA1 family)